ncbi:2-dehydropantoate 2-reductase [Sulfitobacter sp.]|jgi:2-dehydropantoate 2-reductase|uniref:2-dehydropantoate 2-reductase n=1 Tax=Sulfitobacter sp. TaxID=1903071 RepID=UPI0039E436A2
MTSQQPIVVAGAGAIGCFLGGILAARGHDVTLLARRRVMDQITENGLHLTDFGGLDVDVSAQDLTLTDDPDCLKTAALVLVTVKTADTAAMAREINRNAPKDAVVISLQNGMEAAQTLRNILPAHDVRAGMVPFNVVPAGAGSYHRSTSGDIVIEAGETPLADHLSHPDLVFENSDDIAAVQWGKLLINLNNALNALSGLTLQAQLLSRPWRLVMAAQMVEALNVLKAHGIQTRSSTPLPSGLIPWVLRLPTPLFQRVAAKMLTIDPTARTSMSYDLEAGKPTEIDALQGVIIRLGAEKSVPTPLCTRVQQHINQATGQGIPHLSPTDI